MKKLLATILAAIFMVGVIGSSYAGQDKPKAKKTTAHKVVGAKPAKKVIKPAGKKKGKATKTTKKTETKK